MEPYKIEKNIKVPAPSRPKTAGVVSRAASTMLALEPGDSFLIKDALDAIRAEKSMRDMIGNGRARKNGRRFASRRLKNGLRIWRIQ